MGAGPSKSAEFLLAILIPPACREEVLGDLHERYRSAGQYAAEALSAVPLVILSRIRRTSEARVVLTQALGLYVSFSGAAWITDVALLCDEWGLLRLAIPVMAALLGLALADAYANPRRPSPLGMVRAPVAAIGLALGSQAALWVGTSGMAVPWPTMAYGCAMGLLFSTGIRTLFPLAAGQRQAATAPASWLKQAPGPAIGLERLVRVAKGVAPVIALLLVALLAYQVWKRGS